MHVFTKTGIVFGAILVAVAAVTDRWTPPPQPRIFNGGELSYLLSSGQDSLREYWYDVADRSEFIFSVASCSSATLYFTEHHAHIYNSSLKVVLGGKGNTYSSIASAVSGEEYDAVALDKVLDCSEQNSFWAQWRFNFLVIGQGRLVGENVLLSYLSHDTRRIVNSIGLTGADGNTAQWQVRENSGSILHAYTTGNDYGTVWKDVQQKIYFAFKLKGCSEARIMMTSSQDTISGDVYEIVLGAADGKNYIRGTSFDTTDVVLATSDIEVLDCDEYRNFWLSWKDGTIRVGVGSFFGDQVFMYHVDQYPIPVRALTVRTAGDKESHWRFEDDLETVTTFITPPRGTYPSHWFESPRKYFATFSVMACETLAIVLSAKDGIDVDSTYTIHLNAADRDNPGKRINGLRIGFTPAYLTSAESVDTLSCTESRDFWLFWRNNVIEMGSGKEYGFKPLFPAYSLGLSNYNIQSIGFMSIDSGEATWRVPESVGEKLRIFTPGTKTVPLFTDNWRTVQTELFDTFRVQTCGDAHIAVSATTGVSYGEPFYEVMLGARQENTSDVISEIRIRQDAEVVTLLQRIDQPDILNCDAMQDYWISWANGMIQVGRGLLPGQQVIMGTPNVLDIAVKALAYDTINDNMAEWEFNEDSGDDLIVVTSGDYKYDHWMMTPNYVDFVTFSVQACSDVDVVITTDVHNLDAEFVEIRLGGQGNTLNTIRSGPNGEVHNSTEGNLLSCDGVREFWLSWKDGLVEIGKGVLVEFTYPLLSYQAPHVLDIKGLSFTTAKKSQGTWHWKQRSFPVGHFVTRLHTGYTRQITRTVEHVRNTLFGIQGCTEAEVLFSDMIALKTNNAFVLRIGVNRNQETAIESFHPGPTGIRVMTRRTPNILSCDEVRYFWASWSRRDFTFGSGQLVGQNPILNYRSSGRVPINSMSVGSGPGERHLWTLPMFEDWYTPGNRTAPPTRSPDTGGDTDTSGLSGGQVAGIIIGVIMGLIAIIVVVVVVLEKNGAVTLPKTSDMFSHIKFSNENGGSTTLHANGGNSMTNQNFKS